MSEPEKNCFFKVLEAQAWFGIQGRKQSARRKEKWEPIGIYVKIVLKYKKKWKMAKNDEKCRSRIKLYSENQKVLGVDIGELKSNFAAGDFVQ